MYRFTLELSTSYRILLNDAKTRAFVCVLVPVSSFSFATLQKLVTNVVDPALQAFNQSVYYEVRNILLVSLVSHL